MPIDATSRKRFRDLANQLGGTNNALDVLRNVEKHDVVPGFTAPEIASLADAASDAQWARFADEAVLSIVQTPPAPAGEGSTVSRSGRGLPTSTASDLVRELRLNETFPVDHRVVTDLNAKYPLRDRMKDEFPEGRVFATTRTLFVNLGLIGTTSAGTGRIITSANFIADLRTLAASKPDLARAVLSDGDVRAALAECLQGPIGMPDKGVVGLLAMLPFSATDAELKETGTARTRRVVEQALLDVIPDSDLRSRVVARLLELQWPVSETFLIAQASFGFGNPKHLALSFARGNTPTGKALIVDGETITESALLTSHVREATRIPLERRLGGEVLTDLVASSIRSIARNVGPRTVDEVARALAEQGPFEGAVPGGVAMRRNDLGQRAFVEFFTLTDELGNALGKPVEVYTNHVQGGIDEVPVQLTRSAPDRPWDGSARFP